VEFYYGIANNFWIQSFHTGTEKYILPFTAGTADQLCNIPRRTRCPNDASKIKMGMPTSAANTRYGIRKAPAKEVRGIKQTR